MRLWNAKKSILVLSAFAAVLLLSQPVEAQLDKCRPNYTVIKCLDEQLDSQVMDKSATAAESEAMAMAETIENVAGRAAVAIDSGAIIDTLAPLFAAFGVGDDASENGDLTAKKNFYFGPSKVWRGTLGAKLLADPDLYAPLTTSLESQLEASAASDQISLLKSDISDYQNLDVEFQLSFEGQAGNHQWGRRPGAYLSVLASAYAAARDEQTSIAEAQRDLAQEDMSVMEVSEVKQALNWVEATASTDEEKRAGREARADAQKLVKLFDKVLEAEGKARVSITALSSKNREVVADLIANQPQLVLSATYKDRDDLVVGPDSLQASLKVEVGTSGNVNDLRSWSRSNSSKCPDRVRVDDRDELAFRCIGAYLEATKRDPEKGNRFSLTATYSDIDEFSFDLPDQDLTFSTPQTEKWTAALSYGRWLSGVDIGLESDRSGRARLDLEAKWEDPTDDEMRQERLVATLTLSQKTTACTTLSFGLVWANEPEFLGEVDQDLGARLGLRWDNEKLKDCMGSK